ncbi:uncharacterized protein LOC127002396 [Eriocheir sinensis]|uniref:uncharacterized protein LOC127002396 n=1 Tax=Eriocheir sinensis TaxID=95602 RepID=UPI0021C61E7D|nr:uncharacterized protein LOC127002396 [Eriocheir sinensis]
MGCGPCRWTEAVVGLLMGLLAGAAAVVAAVTFYQCTNQSLLNYWLMINGMVTLGAFMGLVVWRLAPIPGRYINALTFLTGFLIFLNVAWLILGNVAVGLVYSVCFVGASPDVYLDIEVNCSSYILPLTLAVVVIFDVLCVILIAVLCVQAFSCEADSEDDDEEEEGEKKEDYSGPSVWWVSVVFIILFAILSVVAIAVGATFLSECSDQISGPVWLIVFGCVTIFVLLLGLYWTRYRWEAGKLWSAPGWYLVLPFLVLFLLHLSVISGGNVLLFEVREESCEGEAACSNALQVTQIVIGSIVNLLLVALVYYGAVFFLVGIFFFIVTFYYYCCGDADEDLDEEAPIKQDA